MSTVLEARDLRKSFRGGDGGTIEVLRGVDLAVETGEFVAVTGESGSGKSTLLHLLGALDLPTSGQVRLGGTAYDEFDAAGLAELRNRRIGFVFQFHHLLPEFNSLENVMLPGLISNRTFEETEKRAKQLLDELGLSKRIKHRPGELSGGEQQRVAVARALLQNPKIVLADEPTGNLDTATGNALFELLTERNRKNKTTFVIVTHNKTLSDRCHRVLEMADGRFV